MTIETPNSRVEEVIQDLFGPDFVSLERRSNSGPDRGVDALLRLKVGRKKVVAALQFKSELVPSQIPTVAHQLKEVSARLNYPAIVVCKVVGERAAEICRDYELNWIDHAGNAETALPGIRLRVRGRAPVKIERKDKGSLFTYKSSKIVHALLSHPGQSWTTISLAETSQVSHGLVIRARKLLEEQGYARVGHGSLTLIEPLELLKEWSKNFRTNRVSLQAYSLERPAQILDRLSRLGSEVLLAEYSAAERFSNYAASPFFSLYCQSGLSETAELIGVKPVDSGGNILLYKDDAAWQFCEKKGPFFCTSLVRTILELSALKGRAADASDRLIEAEFLPRWKQ